MVKVFEIDLVFYRGQYISALRPYSLRHERARNNYIAYKADDVEHAGGMIVSGGYAQVRTGREHSPPRPNTHHEGYIALDRPGHF
jgi:hypothetical protein